MKLSGIVKCIAFCSTPIFKAKTIIDDMIYNGDQL